MKRLLILTIVLCFNFNFGQNTVSELSGNWIKYKAEMKDGSELLDRLLEEKRYFEFIISKNTLCITAHPTHRSKQSCLHFTMIDNFLKTSPYSGFLIEKITKDSLIISEKIDGLTPDKEKRIYLVNKQVLLDTYKEEYKNRKNIVASELFTPYTNSSLEFELYDALKHNFSNHELIGKITIYPLKKKVTTQITYSTDTDSTRLKTIKKVIDKSFKKWNLTNFNEYESIELPFILKSIKTDVLAKIDIVYFTNNLSDFDTLYGNTFQNLRKAAELFDKGISEYNDKKYQSAIEYFNESYSLNNKNIDALYNVASIYFQSGDKENACKVWKEISELGQVTAKELHKKNCE